MKSLLKQLSHFLLFDIKFDNFFLILSDLAIRLRKLLFDSKFSPDYDYDQDILKRLIWPQVKHLAIIHESYYCHKWPINT